jgi:hypothetical protein
MERSVAVTAWLSGRRSVDLKGLTTADGGPRGDRAAR